MIIASILLYLFVVLPSTRSINIMMEAHRKHYVTTIVSYNNNNNNIINNNQIINNSININNNDKNNYPTTATTTSTTTITPSLPIPSPSISSSSPSSSSSSTTTTTTTTSISTSIDSIYQYYKLFSTYSLPPDSFTYSTLVRAATNSSQVKQALRLAGIYFNPPLLRCAIVSIISIYMCVCYCKCYIIMNLTNATAMTTQTTLSLLLP